MRLEPLLDIHDLARHLGMSPEAVYVLRSRGLGPPAVRLGKRSIRFRASDVEKWLESRRERQTEEVGA